MSTFTVPLTELGRADLARAGGKGAGLGELVRAGLPVPPGFVLTTAAYDEFVASAGIREEILRRAEGPDPETAVRAVFAGAEFPEAVRKELLAAYEELGSPPVAVRSSATAEDLPEASFAGQQATVLHVRGADALVAAVRDCWASLWTQRAIAYRARQGVDPGALSLAVVVQQMVDADAAGVMFTANPADGRRDETVLSAAWGLGESVVGGTVTTDDVVVDRSGRVRSRRTADKAVMTVPVDGGTAEVPVPAQRRREPVLDDAAAVALAGLGARAQEYLGGPQDVEWARADGTFWLVQARPITALPEPEAEPPTDWTVPDPTAMYVRASIVEQLPDPLSPLFADLVDGSVERSLRALLAEVAGTDVLRDGDVGLPTVNGYAYYRYSRRGMLRMLVLTPGAMRLLTDPEGAIARWRTVARPRYASAVERWAKREPSGLGAATLLDGAVELLDAGTAYYTSVQTIIPLAVTSEVLFTRLHERFVRREGDPPAAAFLLGFDSTPIRAEKSLYDLATWAGGRPQLVDALLGGSVPDDPEWRERWRAHLDRFGHTVYNLDVVNPVPVDDPAPLLDTLRFFLRGEASDPYERQRRATARREEATAAARARLDPVRRAAFDRLLAWAQRSAPVREDALADVGLAWPTIRWLLLELGRRLAGAGAVGDAADVFWLLRAELRALAAAWDAGGRSLPDHRDAVAERKAEWRGRRRVTPPQVLPRTSWMRLFDRMMPATTPEQAGPVLRGTGASAGQVTALARVLGGPADFARLQPGDVLVASITTPAWTPLFARAAAVVTDIGGPLSHGSIVAREYGIPAVLGTAVATRRIRDGERVRVDGDAGTVTLLDEPAESPVAPGVPGPRAGVIAAGAVAVAGVAGLCWRRRWAGRA